MSKRMKASSNRRSRRRRVIRVQLPAGGLGFIASEISRKSLKRFAASLKRAIARRRCLIRAAAASRYAQRVEAGESPMTERVVRLEIRGLVQGVGYRWSMVEEARRLGLRGWVRNRRDGSVEATAAGAANAIEALIEWAGRGPGAATVESVEVFEAEGSFSNFEQRPTE